MTSSSVILSGYNSSNIQRHWPLAPHIVTISEICVAYKKTFITMSKTAVEHSFLGKVSIEKSQSYNQRHQILTIIFVCALVRTESLS